MKTDLLYRLTHRVRLFVLTVAAAMLPITASAVVVMSNTPNGTNGGSTVSSTSWKALVFRTGLVASRMNEVILGLNPENTLAALPLQAKVEIALFAASADVPTVQLATTGLVNVDIQQRRESYTFPIGSAFVMSANTQYALVIRSDALSIKWGNTDPGTQPTASRGFVYNTFSASSDSGATWTTLIGMQNALSISVLESVTLAGIPTLSELGLVLLVSLMGLISVWQVRRLRY